MLEHLKISGPHQTKPSSDKKLTLKLQLDDENYNGLLDNKSNTYIYLHVCLKKMF